MEGPGSNRQGRIGATFTGDGECRFEVWAPAAGVVEIHLLGPDDGFLKLHKNASGYHQGRFNGIRDGALYRYRLDGGSEYPDPASRFQPHGVHGPSQIVSSHYEWRDADWSGLLLNQYITYELHVGTYTPEGTFDAIVPYLDNLKELGITAIELMPVAQFPGNRNWGYDGVYPFAVQSSYGGPGGLKRLVDACHQRNLAVVLDVVYNHLGPEGNYLACFGPYFTDRYCTPWGQALNFDGPHSDDVRRLFVENAEYWVGEFHIDALRLDALHAILDFSSVTFLEDLADSVRTLGSALNRRVHLIGESDANNRRVITSREAGGYGLDAQWNEGFHHAVHSLLTGERQGYYQDFGGVEHLAKAFREGFVYSGQYSTYRKRRHGSPSRDIPADRFVVFSQNHDQIGNRMLGERLSSLVPFESLKLAAGVVLLSPSLPLVFMGEEYGETAPFQYFTSHSDPALIEAVRNERRNEFSAFQQAGEPPDPQSESTFVRSRLNHQLRNEGSHRALLNFYRELLRLRVRVPALACISKDDQEVLGYEDDGLLFVRRWHAASESVIAFNLASRLQSVTLPVPPGRWAVLLDSSDKHWLGERTQNRDVLESDGHLTLEMGPTSLVLLSINREA
jgi:maltooligosyltrehalose trehalohydrolase